MRRGFYYHLRTFIHCFNFLFAEWHVGLAVRRRGYQAAEWRVGLEVRGPDHQAAEWRVGLAVRGRGHKAAEWRVGSERAWLPGSRVLC